MPERVNRKGSYNPHAPRYNPGHRARSDQYPFLPPIEGVLAPDDPRYEKRLKVLHNMNGNKSSRKSSREDSQNCTPGLPKKYQEKSTFNINDIQNNPVGKFLRILEEILSEKKGFTLQTKT